ncbi:MAG: NADH-quinone oxidoreductase subunit J [Proteobacteria bacterium]|nr:NADH-quinone oxidoreductase subunit J [Pseudomonadota bacterium]
MNAYYQFVAEVFFVMFILLTLIGSWLAVNARILMHSVLGLAVSLLGVAGLYFYLGSMFLTMMQILIYMGAVCIVLVFGIMVGYTPNESADKHELSRNMMLGLVTSGVAAFLLIVVAIGKTTWTQAVQTTGNFSIEWLGKSLLLEYCLAFELISVVLLIAIVGAIILARGGREEEI